jgi:glycosyltransferase involved in cell wall biosynthesis
MKTLSVGFLVLNENINLEDTINKALVDLEKITPDFELWIFDNHSSDGTSTTVKKMMKKFHQLKLFIQRENIGYAQNLNSAIKNMKAKYLFIVDGDGQYDLSNIKNAIALLNNKHDIVFGIRKPRRDPIIRIMMSYFLNVLARIIINSNLKDINCGFRGFNYNVSKFININYKYNFAGPEVFAICKINKFNIAEMKINHLPRKAGVSYFNGIFKVINSCIDMIKYLFKLKKKISKNI